MEITKGLVLFVTGIGGIAISIVVGIVTIVVMKHSKNKLQTKLDVIYKI